jgi:hypothetical protein
MWIQDVPEAMMSVREQDFVVYSFPTATQQLTVAANLASEGLLQRRTAVQRRTDEQSRINLRPARDDCVDLAASPSFCEANIQSLAFEFPGRNP